MPMIHRLTDINSAGGAINGIPQDDVFANNLLVSVNGSVGTSHPPCPIPPIHCQGVWVTNEGCSTVFVNNIPVNHEGNADTCGHPRIIGSPDVFLCDEPRGGALIDHAAPYTPFTVPINAQPNPPAGTTPTDVFIYENNDDPEELGPEPSPVTVLPTEPPEQEDDEEPPPPANPAQDCSDVDSLPANFNWVNEGFGSFAAWAASFQLSPNFTVADLTINTAVSTYPFTTSVNQAAGLSQKEILGNLCYHAKTVLEPLLAQVGPYTITSGFRNKSGRSQHNKGQATDIQFLGFHGASNTGAQYYNRAVTLRDSLEYDQFILEWFARNPWLHISSNSSGHRKQVLTQTSSTSFAPGLKQLRP